MTAPAWPAPPRRLGRSVRGTGRNALGSTVPRWFQVLEGGKMFFFRKHQISLSLRVFFGGLFFRISPQLQNEMFGACVISTMIFWWKTKKQMQHSCKPNVFVCQMFILDLSISWDTVDLGNNNTAPACPSHPKSSRCLRSKLRLGAYFGALCYSRSFHILSLDIHGIYQIPNIFWIQNQGASQEVDSLEMARSPFSPPVHWKMEPTPRECPLTKELQTPWVVRRKNIFQLVGGF